MQLRPSVRLSTRPRGSARVLLLLSFLLPLTAVASQGQIGKNAEKGHLRVVADPTAYAPGAEITRHFKATIDDGWHVNSHTPTYDYLIPTKLSIELPDGWTPAKVSYPAGEMKTFAFADKPLSVYEGTFDLPVVIQVPRGAKAGTFDAKATFSYQSCNDHECLPPASVSQPFTLLLASDGARETPAASSSSAAGGAPGASGSGAGGAAASSGASATGAIGGHGLFAILLLGLLGGLILNAMPCVLPVLSLKVLGLVRSAGEGRAAVTRGALATTAGILVSFWALAGAAIGGRAAGAAVGWGVQFQQPVFVAALAVVMLLFSLNLWGMFEIRLPGFLARAGNAGMHEGLSGHFASGLFATLMATPCSAPFLGTALGFALSQGWQRILAVFTAVGVGMALPYIALAVAPGSARFLPKPGAWMDNLKRAMGFLLTAAIVWLLYVLSSQIDPVHLAFFELGLLALAFAIWILHRAGGRRWWKAVGIVATALTLVFSASVVVRAARPAASKASSEPAGSAIAWQPFDEARALALARSGRLVFVDVTADWCFTCKANEHLVLDSTQVGDAFSRFHVIAMRADWTNRSDKITRFLVAHGRYGIPFYILFRPGQQPYRFSELLTRNEIVNALRSSEAKSASTQPVASAAGPSSPTS